MDAGWLDLAARIAGGAVAYLGAGVAVSALWARAYNAGRSEPYRFDRVDRGLLAAGWPVIASLLLLWASVNGLGLGIEAIGRLSMWIFPGDGELPVALEGPAAPEPEWWESLSEAELAAGIEVVCREMASFHRTARQYSPAEIAAHRNRFARYERMVARLERMRAAEVALDRLEKAAGGR